MRVLWLSHAPFLPAGYGNQTGQIAKHLPALGHELAFACIHGLDSAALILEDLTLFPAGDNPLGDDLMAKIAETWKPDVVVSLFDSWALNFFLRKEWATPWIAWEPIHSQPHSVLALRKLRFAAQAVGMSRWGQAQLQAARIPAEYIPHGVDTQAFQPKAGMKAALSGGLDERTFLVSMVAANVTTPSRKAIPEALVAFSRFHKRHPRSRLYLHMHSRNPGRGFNLESAVAQLGIADAVLWVDQAEYAWGRPTPYLAAIYQATDVLLNPSMGEGFGIPIMEAAACGTPTIATDFSSMTELVESAGGWLVGGQPWLDVHENWWCMPSAAQVQDALEAAYGEWQTPQWHWRRQAARALAEQYDFGRRTAPAWDQLLRSREWQMPVDDEIEQPGPEPAAAAETGA